MYLRGCIVGPETDVLVPLWIFTLVRHIQEAVLGPKHVRRDRAIWRRASLATDGDTFSRTILKVNRACRIRTSVGHPPPTFLILQYEQFDNAFGSRFICKAAVGPTV